MGSDTQWLIAPDAFKGTYSAKEVTLAIAAGLREVDSSAAVDLCPSADGGEGTLEVLVERLGGRCTSAEAHDPLGRPISAPLGWLQDGTSAIVAVAGASGLGLLTPSERDAELASTIGTGELIAAAVRAGATRVIIAAGGSASTDGGRGAIHAIQASGGLRGAQLTVLADVTTTFERAAEVFAPQKGADAATVRRLTARLHGQAPALPRDPRGLPMTGAAGGLAGGLWARYGATLVPGAEWVLDALGFDERIARAGAVITGEGRLDAQTLEGKLVSQIAGRARGAGVPVHAVVGGCALTRAERAQLALATVHEAHDRLELAGAGRALAATALSP
ncbi:MAG: glycerate kinase family protein [Solirubrobacteraceae bacterium]